MFKDPQDVPRDISEMFARIFSFMPRDFMLSDTHLSCAIPEYDEHSSLLPCLPQPGQQAGPEPDAEVLCIDDEVIVITGLPGVTRENLNLTMKGNILCIDAVTGTRRYHTSVNLPPVDPDPVRVSLKNGVLEARFRTSSWKTR
ncbi:MAG: Hsp20/alpha crystallin family protein [Methanoregula sp.]|nr:Hsp20/alpha crystallin family protein [Methanoregula sp.]